MTVRRLVEVEYEYPGVGLVRSVGQIEESDDYVVVVWQWVEGYDICHYLVIPKSLVKKIVELETE